MPTRPDPNSPFVSGQIESALGMTAPGTPSMAGKPGVQAGDVSYPAAPGVNTAPPGRPAGPQAPTPSAGTPYAVPSRAHALNTAPQPPNASIGGGVPVMPPTMPVPKPGQLPLGATVPTTAGVATRDATGTVSLALSPEGDMQYRQAVMAGREKLGPLPRIFRHPSLPEMPFELGQQNFNPFTSAWSKG